MQVSFGEDLLLQTISTRTRKKSKRKNERTGKTLKLQPGEDSGAAQGSSELHIYRK